MPSPVDAGPGPTSRPTGRWTACCGPSATCGPGQALTLLAYVPLYGWVAQKLPRQRFLAGA